MARLLDSIENPQDLKKLTQKELETLAQEIREEVVHTVSVTGGHLGPNLGSVEITLALHTVLDAPRDRIVWDVGHQSYPHKLLTGRRDRFHTLRQFGGVSGFTRRAESPHDHFGAGHASTSVSAALGMAVARDQTGDDYKVVAVMGDGALTGGMAYEALNNAGQLGTDFVVLINDNAMSIAPNVGAISAYLTRLRTDATLKRARDDIEWLLGKIPAIGGSVVKVAERLKGSVKHLFVPGSVFTELGFTYFGPMDGHNLPLMQRVLKDAFRRGGPVVIHAVTEKGRGYEPAESAPDKMHGGGPFTVQVDGLKGNGNGVLDPARFNGHAAESKGNGTKPAPAAVPAKPKPPSFSEVVGRTLVRMAKADERILAVTAAMPGGTGLSIVAKEVPEQFMDVGIAEQHAVTFCGGMATAGMRPVAAIYSTFLQRGYDQVIHDICVQNLSVAFVMDRAGIAGEDGPTHHGAFDLAYLRCLPNMVIMSPKDENELANMVYTAVYHDGPAAVRYPKASGRGVVMDETLQPVPLGKGELLRQGSDITLAALGPLTYAALAAADKLAEQGIEATVINARWAKPLDDELILEAARHTGRVVTIEDAALMGGFGSAVLESFNVHGLTDVQVKRLGLPDEFLEHGAISILHQQCGLTADGIAGTAATLVKAVPSDLPKRRKAAGGGE